MQNQNNRPIAFGGFKSVVAGRSMREDNQFIALALRLTGKDLRDFEPVLKDFSNPKLENDVVQISVAGYNGNSDSPYGFCINHINIDDSNKFTTLINKKIHDLLERIWSAKKIDLPAKDSEEAEKMKKALVGGRTYIFNADEICSDEHGIKGIAEELDELAPATGKENSFVHHIEF